MWQAAQQVATQVATKSSASSGTHSGKIGDQVSNSVPALRHSHVKGSQPGLLERRREALKAGHHPSQEGM